jgi:hypothetical protein
MREDGGSEENPGASCALPRRTCERPSNGGANGWQAAWRGVRRGGRQKTVNATDRLPGVEKRRGVGAPGGRGSEGKFVRRLSSQNNETVGPANSLRSCAGPAGLSNLIDLTV